MRKVIERCPACQGDLMVTRLACGSCHTEIHGRFRSSSFSRLSPEHLAFVETFVRLRGNVKEMERELGVPYSAVRSELDDVIEKLGFEAVRPPVSDTPRGDASGARRAILDRLDRGEISADSAAEELGRLK